MRRITAFVMAALLLPAGFAMALDMTAQVKTDISVLTDSPAYDPDYTFAFNRSDLVLKFTQSTDNMKGYAELDLVAWGLPGTGLFGYGDVSPYEVRLNEAYAGFYGVGFDFLDLTVGKQVVSWGTADKLNQTDILTPYDFSDPLDFNKRVGANMLRADINAGPVTVQALLVPVFTQSLLYGPMDPALAVEKEAKKALAAYPVSVELSGVTAAAENPGMKLDNCMEGARAGFKVLDTDVHLGYFRGYLTLPEAAESVTDVTVVNPYPGVYVPVAAEVDTLLRYPKVQMAGADLAGSLFSVGVWAEAGVYVPEEFSLTKTTNKLLGGAVIASSTEVKTVLKDPYVKYTVGGDYTFGDGTYVNLQFMHGFFSENGDALSDLAFGRVEKAVFDEKIKLSLEGGLEFDFNKDRNVTPGALLLPSVKFIPFDSTEIEISGVKVFANQKEDGRYHLVNSFAGYDRVSIKASYTF